MPLATFCSVSSGWVTAFVTVWTTSLAAPFTAFQASPKMLPPWMLPSSASVSSIAPLMFLLDCWSSGDVLHCFPNPMPDHAQALRQRVDDGWPEMPASGDEAA